MMNLNIFKRDGKSTQDDDDEEEDDNSETWSLPRWSELEDARRSRAKRIEKLRKARLKKAAELNSDEQKRHGSGEAGVPLNPSGVKPRSSALSTNTEEDDDDDDEDMKNRGKWNNSCEFLLSIISMSVGMGNFYRFPFVAYQNGGGAFLIPYLIVLTFVGRPMYFLELAMGQFCSFGQVKVWEMSPFFRGVGFGSALSSFVVVTYYSSVMSTTIYYFFNSFRAKLPWTVCDPEWAGNETCEFIENATRYNKYQNKSMASYKGMVNLPQLYFERQVIGELDNIDDGIGVPHVSNTLCLLCAWVIIFLVMVRGVQSTGKAAYFITSYPYIIILVMLISACTKPGAWGGMLYFVSPDWKRVLEPSVWFAAAGQCFFSLSTGFGPIINYASFSPFHHPIYRDAIIVSFMDTFASFIAGLTVFATLGTLAYSLDKSIEDVVDSGPGLVFVSFSESIGSFSYVPQILSILFFSMLLTLGIGSSVAWEMACISVISDYIPKVPKIYITVSMCVSGFLLALIYMTPGGQFMLTLVDNFGGNVNIYILATIECIAISWVYGLNNFCKDIEFMLNKKVGWFWKLCWGFVIPVLLTILMVYTFATQRRLEHNGKEFPDSAIICGWLLATATLAVVPAGAIYAMYKQSGTLKERFLGSLKPTTTWGPRRPHDKERWLLFRRGIIAKGGPAPDTFVLPPGETPENNTLPDWLEVKPDGKVGIKIDRGDTEEEQEAVKSAVAPNNANDANDIPTTSKANVNNSF